MNLQSRSEFSHAQGHSGPHHVIDRFVGKTNVNTPYPYRRGFKHSVAKMDVPRYIPRRIYDGELVWRYSLLRRWPAHDADHTFSL